MIGFYLGNVFRQGSQFLFIALIVTVAINFRSIAIATGPGENNFPVFLPGSLIAVSGEIIFEVSVGFYRGMVDIVPHGKVCHFSLEKVFAPAAF